VLQSHGLVHSDSEWRNMLWDDQGGRLFVIDLEEVKWLKRSRALEPTSGNMRHGYRVGAVKCKQKAPVQLSCCLLMAAPRPMHHALVDVCASVLVQTCAFRLVSRAMDRLVSGAQSIQWQ
jgi:hypothetical protein